MKFKGLVFDFNSRLLERVRKKSSHNSRGHLFSDEKMFEPVHGKPNRHILECLTELQILSSEKEVHRFQLCLKSAEDFPSSLVAIDLFGFLVETDSEKDNQTSISNTSIWTSGSISQKSFFEVKEISYVSTRIATPFIRSQRSNS